MNWAAEVRQTGGLEMTPRHCQSIWNLETVLGSNAMPPRDPDDDEEEENEEYEQDDDRDDEPAVVREPDE